MPSVANRDGVATLTARGRIADFRGVHRAYRTDGRRLVARHPGAEQTGHRDRRDDADDCHDDQQLDERKAFVLLQYVLTSFSLSARCDMARDSLQKVDACSTTDHENRCVNYLER